MISRGKERQMWIFSFEIFFGGLVERYFTSIKVQLHYNTWKKQQAMELLKIDHTRGNMGLWILSIRRIFVC